MMFHVKLHHIKGIMVLKASEQPFVFQARGQRFDQA